MAAEIIFPPTEVFLRSSPDPTPAPDCGEQHNERPTADRLDQQQQQQQQIPAKAKNSKPQAAKSKPAGRSKAAQAAQDGLEKPKMSKSRTGCITCKLKRLKCDETKPTCQQCQRRKVECGGYKRDFKWRSFDEVTVKASAPTAPRKRKPSPPNQKQPNTAADSTTSKRDSFASLNLSTSLNRGTEDSPLSKQTSHSNSDGRTVVSPLGTESPSVADDGERSVSCASTAEHQISEASKDLSGMHIAVEPRPDGPHGMQSAAVADNLINPLLLVIPGEPPAAMTTAEIDSILASCDDELVDPAAGEVDADDDIVDMDHPSFDPATTPDLTLVPAEMDWATGQYYKTIPMDIDISPDGVDAIAQRFDRVTCGILSVKDGPTENPWRTMVWPMAQSSPSLFHAVCAMASFHASRQEPYFKTKGHEHMQLCFQNLSEGLRENSITLENAIATSLTLGFAQSWLELTSSGNVYIKGASSIINKALTEHRQRKDKSLRNDRLKFLCNAWVYMDVIVRLTRGGGDDEEEEYDRIFSAFSTPDTDHDGFGIDFGLPMDSCMDPLMGCANTLFPLIGRAANLARRVKRSSPTPLVVVDQARELKDLIEAWRPPMYIQPPEDTTSTVEHGVQTAEAYRWAALLHLHQTVPELPMPTSAQLAAKVLVLLATVPLSSRFVIIHIFPLMAAGCEAARDEDRAWVRHRWAAIGRRLDIGTIDKCVEITEEVWRRRDDEAGPSSSVRQALVSTANMQYRDGGGRLIRRQSYDPNPSMTAAFQNMAGWAPNGMIHDRNSGFSPVEGAGSLMSGSFPEPSWLPQMRGDWHDDGIAGQYHLGGRLHWLGVMKEWGWEVLLG